MKRTESTLVYLDFEDKYRLYNLPCTSVSGPRTPSEVALSRGEFE